MLKAGSELTTFVSVGQYSSTWFSTIPHFIKPKKTSVGGNYGLLLGHQGLSMLIDVFPGKL